MTEGADEAVPGLKVSKVGDRNTISIDHPDRQVGAALLMKALGLTDLEFYKYFVTHLGSRPEDPGLDEREINFARSVVKGIKPRDQIEAMLAAQMAAVHTTAMTFAGRLAKVEHIDQQDSAERAFNKLLRTFTAQMEALKR